MLQFWLLTSGFLVWGSCILHPKRFEWFLAVLLPVLPVLWAFPVGSVFYFWHGYLAGSSCCAFQETETDAGSLVFEVFDAKCTREKKPPASPLGTKAWNLLPGQWPEEGGCCASCIGCCAQRMMMHHFASFFQVIQDFPKLKFQGKGHEFEDLKADRRMRNANECKWMKTQCNVR